MFPLFHSKNYSVSIHFQVRYGFCREEGEMVASIPEISRQEARYRCRGVACKGTLESSRLTRKMWPLNRRGTNPKKQGSTPLNGRDEGAACLAT